MSTSTVPVPGSLSFQRIVDVPLEACAAALDSWQHAGHGGGLRIGGSQVIGPTEHDRDTGTRWVRVRLARGPLRPRLSMRLHVDRRSSSSTALELIPGRRVRPTANYFRAGHRLLDSLTRFLAQQPIPDGAWPAAGRPHVPVASGCP